MTNFLALPSPKNRNDKRRRLGAVFYHFPWAENCGLILGKMLPHTVALARPLKQQKQTKTLRRLSLKSHLDIILLPFGEYHQNFEKRQRDYK